MMRKYIGVVFSLFFLMFSSCGQTNNKRSGLGETNARNELQKALIDTVFHNVINTRSLIVKDKETAINIVEPILFATYNKSNIIKQRPYEVYLIDKYWIISGTLPKGYLGGTFLIIVDATNSRIIKLTHGK